MKMKNRRGSTLVLTLMVFAILMILATFLLGFMVTENRQAMYHQNKTQAYYIARSGAEVVEAALKTQLYSYSDNETEQNKFVKIYDDEQDIKVDIDHIINPVKVVNETINGKRVMTINSTAEYNGISQSVKKVLYSTKSIITKEMNGQFIPPGGQLFVYLGDNKPKEVYKNNNGWGYVPDSYVRKASEEEKAQYVKHDFLEFVDWNIPNDVVTNNQISGGTYFTSGDVSNIYVEGSLTMSGDIKFNGTVNLYIKESLYIKSGTQIIGDTITTSDGRSNKLNIYIYNQSGTDNTVALSTDLPSNIKLVGNLYVDKGDVSIFVHQEGYIDGHIIYNGISEVKFSSDSNNFTEKKTITGSIYAPNGTVSLGIHEYKTANIIGGQVIAKTINVYPNNSTQASKFYTHSTAGRENNPIPVDITQNIDIKQYGYESYYVNQN